MKTPNDSLSSNQPCAAGPTLTRCSLNPLISPKDVRPSRPDFVVDGVFNCGAARFGDETLLLCRVAESVRCDRSRYCSFPVVTRRGAETDFDTVTLEKSKHPELNFDDARTVIDRASGRVAHLTSLSHLRVARSKDGIHFHLDDHPAVMPDVDTESWGMEDPRITRIGDTYYINYTAVSPNGADTALLSTRDFRHFERLGCIFLPENKDVVIFPQKFGGRYLAFNRPVPNSIGRLDIWLSDSPDLIHWGGHRHFFSSSSTDWDNGRIGGGAPPFLTDAGWVHIYHAADRSHRYCLGAMLLDRDDPTRILAKSRKPLLEPETFYEKNGFFGNVVFTCGCIMKAGVVQVYYGAADDKVCRADISLADLFRHLGV